MAHSVAQHDSDDMASGDFEDFEGEFEPFEGLAEPEGAAADHEPPAQASDGLDEETRRRIKMTGAFTRLRDDLESDVTAPYTAGQGDAKGDLAI